jgi:transcriptional regulator with XRE-family HTH domain
MTLGADRVWINPREYKVIGSVLAAVREHARLTQKELALRLRKPQSFVSSYENGQRRVDLLEFLRIVAALRANPHKVFASVVSKQLR